MSLQKDYFIKPEGISAYTINAFVEAIVEATESNLSINYDSARRIGISFSVDFKEAANETKEDPQAQAPKAPAQPEEPAAPNVSAAPVVPTTSPEQPSELPETTTGDSVGFTLEDIEAVKGSMAELNKLAEPVGISGRSKADVVEQLKAYINA